MTPERWEQIGELYHAARARPPAERAVFLTNACRGDESLRREVASLLSEPISDDGFLAEPALVRAGHLASDPAYAPMIGRSLGEYRLRAMLGAGGMGEVYRALDPKLGRDVAIKILPPAFTSDPDRLARFEREARMLGALNHPNICAIYGVEQAEGIRFLILELVEGQTLADRLAAARSARASGVPIPEALAVARQIADALECAHDKGIIHRDLKPANVKITPDGVVKVLDFGLAKAVGGDGSAPELTQAPEGTGVGRQGPIMGTAAYMSPEQARGLAVDKRTDIWAFGCVLYEMVTGRAAFPGDTVSDTIAKILEREPDWSALPAETPPSIRRVLLRCLSKDPKKRLRDSGDVRNEIDAIDEVLPGADARVPIPPRGWGQGWLPWLAVVALASALGLREARRPSPVAENPLAHARFTQVTDWEGTEGAAEISPDGNFVTFVSDRDGEFDIWWTQVGTGEFKNLTRDLPGFGGTGGILRTIGFTGAGTEIWFGPSAGGATQKLLMPQTGGPSRPFLMPGANGLAWSADGKRLVYFTQSVADGDPLSIADGAGADARLIPVDASHPDWSGPADTIHNHNPAWSPDGQWIYFVHGSVRGLNPADEMDVWRIRPGGGLPERLTRQHSAVTFLAPIDSSTVLYVAQEANGSGPWLWALDVPTRTTRRASSGLERYTSVSASRDGRRVIATKANPRAGLWTVPIRDGRPALTAQPYKLPTDRALAPRFGGKSTLFYLSARATGDGLWRAEGGNVSEILKGTDGPVLEPPAPSPDGRRVAVVRKRDGKRQLAIMSSNGTDVRTLAPSIDTAGAADWSPDGTTLAIGGRDAAGKGALFLIPVDGGGAPIALVEGDAINPIWSPAGDLVVYAGPLGGGQVPLLGVRPDGTPVALPPIMVSPGRYRFLRDGSGLVYMERPRSQGFSVLDLATKQTRELTRLASRGTTTTFDITPDGESIVFDRVLENSDIVLIEVPEK